MELFIPGFTGLEGFIIRLHKALSGIEARYKGAGGILQGYKGLVEYALGLRLRFRYQIPCLEPKV